MARRLKNPGKTLARYSKAEARRQRRARAQAEKMQAAAKARPEPKCKPPARGKSILGRAWQRMSHWWGRA